jgi:hypothetical protein
LGTALGATDNSHSLAVKGKWGKRKKGEKEKNLSAF